MNIIYCIPHLYNAGGMERVVTQKVRWLAQHTAHAITIITTEKTPPNMHQTYFTLPQNVHIVAFDIDFNADYAKPLPAKWVGHRRRMKRYKQMLQAYIQSHAIDLCISTGGKEVAFLSSLPCRTMVEFHFALAHRQHLLNATHSGWIWRCLGAIRTQQLVHDVKQIAEVVVLTPQDKDEWEQAGCKHVLCIPNPCSLDGLELPKRSISSDKNIVLAAGRLHAQKGFDMLLRAWQQVEKHHPDWTLRIVGQGPEHNQLQQLQQQLNLHHVVFAGQQTDMAAEYANASLFVLSSRYEGLPLVLIEAMWSQVPCVAFDCPHGPQTLLNTERGWLVPANNTDRLANALHEAINNPNQRQTKALQAAKYAHNHYSEQHIMTQWVQLIEHESNRR